MKARFITRPLNLGDLAGEVDHYIGWMRRKFVKIWVMRVPPQAASAQRKSLTGNSTGNIGAMMEEHLPRPPHQRKALSWEKMPPPDPSRRSQAPYTWPSVVGEGEGLAVIVGVGSLAQIPLKEWLRVGSFFGVLFGSPWVRLGVCHWVCTRPAGHGIS